MKPITSHFYSSPFLLGFRRCSGSREPEKSRRYRHLLRPSHCLPRGSSIIKVHFADGSFPDSNGIEIIDFPNLRVSKLS